MCCVRVVRVACFALVLMPVTVFAQTHPASPVRPRPAQTAAIEPTPQPAARPGGVSSVITFADLGLVNGFRFANLAGRRDVFVALPQGTEITAGDLLLDIDDVSAHDARRSLEILVNDNSVAALVLDGKGSNRALHIPLGNARARDGFLKITFQYAGAATQDRCIDARYVGDSLTVRPDTAVAIEIAFAAMPDVVTVAALMPHDVTVVLPRRQLDPSDIAAALTIARSFTASGRRVTFRQGLDTLPDLVKRDDLRAWTRGIVVVASLQEVTGYLDGPLATVAGPLPAFGALMAVRIGGLPALVVSDAASVRAGRLLGSPNLAATRGIASASVGGVVGAPAPRGNQVDFQQLGIALVQAEVLGRADLPVTIDTRALPSGTKPARLLLDVMVAPDGAGERAVVSGFLNDRLVGSTVASIGEPTRLNFALSGVGTAIGVRALVQRGTAVGDCRLEPQGYPAQILGSSVVTLEKADAKPHDFSDLVPYWAGGVEIMLPPSAAERPLPLLDALSNLLDGLTAETSPLAVRFSARGVAPVPTAPFIAVSDIPPADSTPRVRFDRGRVAVADLSGKTLLDVGGFTAGAVAQVVNAGALPGLWIKPLAADGSLPAPAQLRLDRGDVAFIDRSGVALAMSTERDTSLQVGYPEQVSWAATAERYRLWIFGGAALFVILAFVLQRRLRRRPQASA